MQSGAVLVGKAVNEYCHTSPFIEKYAPRGAALGSSKVKSR